MSSTALQAFAEQAREIAREVRRRPMDVAAAFDAIARDSEIQAERQTQRMTQTAADAVTKALRRARAW